MKEKQCQLTNRTTAKQKAINHNTNFIKHLSLLVATAESCAKLLSD